MTVEFVIPASAEKPAPDKLIVAYTAAFDRPAVRGRSARQPRVALNEWQVMTAERRMHRATRGNELSVTAMRSRLASRAPIPAEQAQFNDLFKDLPSDDEG
jgi:hypothetical protein